MKARLFIQNIEGLVNAVKDDIEAQDKPGTLEGAKEYATESVGKTLAEGHSNDPVFVNNLMGVRGIVFSPWWSRCWVAQELIVSQNVVIMLGAALISWDRFKSLLKFVLEVERAIFRKYLSRDADEAFGRTRTRTSLVTTRLI